jgi:2-phosphoglycerate kinase
MKHPLRVVRAGQKIAFSTGAIVEALQGAGIPTDEAITLAQSLEKHYRQEGGNIALDELVERLSGMIAKSVSSAAAARFKAQTPPFTPLMVRFGDGLTPFSRRRLATSLEKLKLSFQDAYAVAQQVEQTLRTQGYEVVGERELKHLIAISLEARLGRDLRLRYETRTPGSDLQIAADGVRFPFSRGILAQSLMGVGLGPELSHALAKRAEELLWRLGRNEVERATVRQVVRSLLISEAGESFARRYDLMRSLRHPERPLVVMIGGGPGVGKSSLAHELAYRLGIPRLVASDSVRQALRSLISLELSPALHSSSFLAWRSELLPGEVAQPKRKRVIRGFQAQVQQLTTALSAVIRRNIEEHTSVVLEGVHLVPGFIPATALQGAVAVELVAAVSDPVVHQRHFTLREVQTSHRRSHESYLEHFTEIRFIQDFVMQRASEEGTTIIEMGDFDQAVERALECVLDAVLIDGSLQASPSVEAVLPER